MLTVGSLFSGYGGLDLAVESVLDAETVWVCEKDPDASMVLRRRFGVPNLRDVTSVDWSRVRRVDVLTGGFPCQDLSLAGRRDGLAGDRSSLWFSMLQAVEVLHPGLVVVENVRGILSAKTDSQVGPAAEAVDEPSDVLDPRAVGRVLGDLAERGYDARWCGLQACDVGAAHRRYRIFIAAYPADAEPGRWGWWPGWSSGRRAESADGGHLATDPGGVGAAGRRGLRHLGGAAAGGTGEGHQRERDRDAADDRGAVAWGEFEPAIRRWESVTGWPAPVPTELGPSGAVRLSQWFTEWLMGLPRGWVTDLLTRKAALRVLGGGVVPQQGAAAVEYLLGTPPS